MPAPFDGKTILIVDDDQDILYAIKVALKETGAHVAIARDGDAAIPAPPRFICAGAGSLDAAGEMSCARHDSSATAVITP